MFARSAYSMLIIYLFVLIASLIAGLYLFQRNEYVLAGICLIAAIISIRGILHTYIRINRKIAFMFDSIENYDNTFRFPEKGITSSDKDLNLALNRIKNIIQQARAETIQQEKYYELILNSVNTGIVVINEKGGIFQTNKTAMKLLGLSLLTHTRQLEQLDNNLPEIFQSIQAGEKKTVSYTNERGTANLSLIASTLKTPKKTFRIIAINDINSELDEKEIESWVRLIRVLTHEIMNSMAPISSLTETLMQIHDNIHPELKNGLEVIHSTSKNLVSFVDSYRQFTRIPTPIPELFYINTFIKNIIQLVQNGPDAEFVKFDMKTEPEDLLVYADERLISQVVFNLLRNSVQALKGQADKQIKIRTYCEKNEEISVEITNNGPAIPPEVIEQIFVPFFTTKESGTGVGLSISRQIMRLHKGSILLKKSIPGETVFLLTFP